MSRHTKIVATLGPSSNEPDVLEAMLRGGVDVVRLNFSHGTVEDHIARAQSVRDAAARVGRHVGILADLQGPKIRVGRFEGGMAMLVSGQPFILDGATTELGTPFFQIIAGLALAQVLQLSGHEAAADRELATLARAASPRSGGKRPPMVEQLEQALLSLGYRPQQAAQAVDAVAGSAEGRDLDDLLREALKRLRG